MRIECGGLAQAEDDSALDSIAADAAIDNALRANKLSLLELLIQHGVALLTAHADGSGDDGSLEDVECFTEPSPDQFESCEVPPGVEELVEQIMEDKGVNFNGDGGFFNLTITTATRECEIEVGWYYTASDSNTESETL